VPIKLIDLTVAGILAASSFTAGLLYERAGHVDENKLQHQIETNELTCMEGESELRTSYPVTHFGELRGCITASRDAAFMDLEQPIFLRKVKP